MSRHTPGPWVADDFCRGDLHNVRVGTTDGESDYYLRTATICECFPGDDDDSHAPITLREAEANAHLIAAAPDMLTALEWFLAPDRPIGSNAEMIHAFREMASAVIAKAKGE